MKKILTIILIFSAGFVKAQTVIPATITIDSLSKLAKGSYRFFRVNKDTVDLTKDTIPKCPVCPICPTIDSAGIINAYLTANPCPICITCPPPVVCPPPTKQRTAISAIITITATNKNITITYDDGSTSTL